MAVIGTRLAGDARDGIFGLESSQRQVQLTKVDIDCRFGLESLHRLMQVREPRGYISSEIDCCHRSSR